MKIFRTKEVAVILRISDEHMRQLIREKKIGAYKEGRRGGFRITEEDVQKYIDSKKEELLCNL